MVDLIPQSVAEKHSLIPVNLQGSSLIVAMSDPSNIYAMDDIKFLTGYNVEVVVASENSIRQAQERYYNVPKDADFKDIIDEAEIDILQEDNTMDLPSWSAPRKSSVVRLVNLILVDGFAWGQ